MDNNLTVLVKKADGTFERKKLSELSSVKKPATPTPAKPSVPPAPIASALKREITRLPSALPQANLKKDDFTSPLEDKLPLRTDSAPVVPADRTKEADEVLKKIKSFISPDILGRLRQLIQLYLKDLRSGKEFLEELAAPVKDKGLGLDGRVAGEVLRLCQEMKIKVAKEAGATVKPLKGRTATPPNLPLVRGGSETLEPATTTPFNAFKHPPLGPARKPFGSVAPASSAGRPVADQKAEKIFKINSQPARPVMQDVIPKAAGVGPIDEIRLFNLTDFRRLSADPHEAAMRFKQKLINLKEASYLLYLDALNAWRESPLYLEYLEAVNNSLKTGKSLATSMYDKNKVQLAEIKAIVEMERSL